MDYEKEMPFGAFDSELMHQEINIPGGFEATIEGNKIILTRILSEDERIRKALIKAISRTHKSNKLFGTDVTREEALTWLEKQGEQKFLTIDIKSMVDSYEQRLIKNGGVSNSPLVNMCVEAFQHGVENTLDELHLKQILANSAKTCKDEWNAEKKELKKIPQRMVSAEAKEALYDKPAWSEDDEDNLNSCIEAIEACYKWDSMVDWLKSLKERIEKH